MIGHLRRKTVTPTLDTNAYADGDQVSTLQTVDGLFTPRGEGELVLVTVLDKANQKVALDLFFFDASVTLASDNDAFTVSDSDMESCIGVVNIAAADYDSVGSASGFATVAPPRGIMLSRAAGGRLRFAIVSRGAPTYAVSSLVFNFTSEARE